MKSLIKSVIISLSLAATSFAASHWDSNPADVYINNLPIVYNPSYTGTFTLNNGYDPLTQQIDSASVQFLLWDAVGNESFTISMEDFTLNHGSVPNSIFTFEDVSFGVFGLTLADLSADGILSYTLTLTSSQASGFWLKNARIDAVSSLRQVPDAGATLALLGLGLAGLVAAKRRLAA